MKVTDLLEQQHREAEKLFDRIQKNDGRAKRELVLELAAKLAAHMRIEEELVYPLAREIEQDLTMEALEEHTVAAFELRRLAEAGLDHESADAKIKTLKELIRHHVTEEEQSLLPALDERLDRRRSQELAQICLDRFESLLGEGYGAELFGERRAKRSAGKRNGGGRRVERAMFR